MSNLDYAAQKAVLAAFEAGEQGDQDRFVSAAASRDREVQALLAADK